MARGDAGGAARILLIRHAESVWNAAGRMQGWADPPLSPAGVFQARALGRQLGGAGPATVAGVLSSDLGRARETAQVIADECNCDGPDIDARLREREVGWLTGLTDEAARQQYPEDVAAWREHRRSRPPGGESSESVLHRARAALAAVIRRAPGPGEGIVVAVSHGGLISVLERDAGLGPGGFANLGGRWVLAAPRGGWQLGERFTLAG